MPTYSVLTSQFRSAPIVKFTIELCLYDKDTGYLVQLKIRLLKFNCHFCAELQKSAIICPLESLNFFVEMEEILLL